MDKNEGPTDPILRKYLMQCRRQWENHWLELIELDFFKREALEEAERIIRK